MFLLWVSKLSFLILKNRTKLLLFNYINRIFGTLFVKLLDRMPFIL